jgi:hypothetical protein
VTTCVVVCTAGHCERCQAHAEEHEWAGPATCTAEAGGESKHSVAHTVCDRISRSCCNVPPAYPLHIYDYTVKQSHGWPLPYRPLVCAE